MQGEECTAQRKAQGAKPNAFKAKKAFCFQNTFCTSANVFGLCLCCDFCFRQSGHIEAVEVHHFVPCSHKIQNEFFVGISACIHFCQGPELRV